MVTQENHKQQAHKYTYAFYIQYTQHTASCVLRMHIHV
jgi:hypothetical protein